VFTDYLLIFCSANIKTVQSMMEDFQHFSETAGFSAGLHK